MELRQRLMFYGKDGDLTGPDREHAEISMLGLHLLRSALVHVNTLLLQTVLPPLPRHDRTSRNRHALRPTVLDPHQPLRPLSQLDVTTHLNLEQPPHASIL